MKTTPRARSARTAAGTSGAPSPIAEQALVPLDVLGALRRLDQLQVEPAARAFEQRALRQDAEVLAARQHGEPEQVPVEVDPVARAVAEDRLHDAEVVQARDRRRIRVGAGQRHEVDVVDREVAVPVDEVDQAVADAVDAGDVELHRRGARRHLPRALVERVLPREAGIAHAQRDRRQRRHRAGAVRPGNASGARSRSGSSRPAGTASLRASGGARPA